MLPHAKTLKADRWTCTVLVWSRFRDTQWRDSSPSDSTLTALEQQLTASCAVDGWCHASPLKPEYEGSVCLSGRITWGRQWWTASGYSWSLSFLHPTLHPLLVKLMMPVAAISSSVHSSIWKPLSDFTASWTCLHPCVVMCACYPHNYIIDESHLSWNY